MFNVFLQCRFYHVSADVLALRHLLKVGLCVWLAIVSSSFHVSLFEIKELLSVQSDYWWHSFKGITGKMQRENKQARTSHYQRCSLKSIKR